MQILGQLFALYISIMMGQIDIICGTVLSLILTFVAMFRHGDVQRHKSALPRFSKTKYFWLVVTSVFVLTGLPLVAIYILAIFLSPNLNPTALMILINICLNAPGIIYFVQASSFFPKGKFKFKLPKYF